MITLDLSKIPPGQWAQALYCALNATPAGQTIEAVQRDGQLRALKSREQGLMAELKDVRERMALLTDANYSRFPGAE